MVSREMSVSTSRHQTHHKFVTNLDEKDISVRLLAILASHRSIAITKL
jgi:hypothetical protein